MIKEARHQGFHLEQHSSYPIFGDQERTRGLIYRADIKLPFNGPREDK